jgi:hypothetical protein
VEQRELDVLNPLGRRLSVKKYVDEKDRRLLPELEELGRQPFKSGVAALRFFKVLGDF